MTEPSIRDRLKGRKRPSMQVPIAVDDVEAATRESLLAEDAWRTCHLQPDGPERAKAIKAARRELDAAIEKLNACYVKVTVRAMPPEEFEALVAAHPPRDAKDIGKDEDPDVAWNGKTLPRAAFLACVDGDMSRSEWEEFLDGQCSRAERDQLYTAALTVNMRTPSESVPKG